jgi:hypothetical protein
MKIYTKTGDKGKTSLASGKRVSKSDALVSLYGICDELNSHIGVAISFLRETSLLKDSLFITQKIEVMVCELPLAPSFAKQLQRRRQPLCSDWKIVKAWVNSSLWAHPNRSHPPGEVVDELRFPIGSEGICVADAPTIDGSPVPTHPKPQKVFEPWMVERCEGLGVFEPEPGEQRQVGTENERPRVGG